MHILVFISLLSENELFFPVAVKSSSAGNPASTETETVVPEPIRSVSTEARSPDTFSSEHTCEDVDTQQLVFHFIFCARTPTRL